MFYIKYLKKNICFIKSMDTFQAQKAKLVIFIIKLMSQLDSIVFGDKKFSDILEEIYLNQKKKSEQVTALISELKPLVQEIGDATLIVPLIKEYMEIGVKNDDALIKMATIIQRVVNNSAGEDALGITEAEKEELLAEMEKIQINKKD